MFVSKKGATDEFYMIVAPKLIAFVFVSVTYFRKKGMKMKVGFCHGQLCAPPIKYGAKCIPSRENILM